MIELQTIKMGEDQMQITTISIDIANPVIYKRNRAIREETICELGIITCFLAAVIPYYCLKFFCNRPAIDAQIAWY